MTRMLIVDDDSNQLRALSRIVSMKQPGLSVVTASSAQEAIDLLRSMPVDLVLTDLQMPDANGFELESRTANPNRCSLRRFFVGSPAKNAGIVVPMSRLFASDPAEKRREMRGSG